MAFKKSDGGTGEISTGTDNWNVAVGYTQLKILRHLYLLDRWDTLAQFGTEEIDEDANYNPNQIRKRRVEGLQRFHSTIKQLLGNVLFALGKKDQDVVKALITRANGVGEFLDQTHNMDNDTLSYEENFTINEKLFKNCLDILEDIKDKLNTPLNNSGLIFRQSDEVDLDNIMKTIVDGG